VENRFGCSADNQSGFKSEIMQSLKTFDAHFSLAVVVNNSF
jgi:hypothetical protein